MKKKKNESNLKEPVVSYKKKSELEFYNTFEEMNEAQIQEMIELPLQERFKFIKEIILKIYNETEESLRKRKNRKHFTIVR